jgi:PilZ domain
MREPLNGADRRSFGRRATYQHAIVHVSGRTPVRCLVLDVSAGGALLDFGEAVSLPSRLRLVWEGSGEEALCEVRHIQGVRAGVQFLCEAGPRIAREMISLKDTGRAAPEALSLKPSDEGNTNAALTLVQEFRKARAPAAEKPGAEQAVPNSTLPASI